MATARYLERSMIPRVEPEGRLFRKPVSTHSASKDARERAVDQVRGRLFRDHALAAALVAAFTISGATLEAPAQTYPSKPVTLIVPYPPGGFVDGLGRIIAKQFGTRTGGTMIVESRPGRDGIVGSYAAARAAPDGYTLLLGDSNPLTVAPLMHATLPYDSMADFTRIATITSSNPIMIARAESPLKSIADVVDAAKARPGKLTYGSGTVGQQLMIEMLKVRANVSMLHVPYKGGSQVMTDLLGGHVDLAATATANYINLRTRSWPWPLQARPVSSICPRSRRCSSWVTRASSWAPGSASWARAVCRRSWCPC
jgi:hypothetical protein